MDAPVGQSNDTNESWRCLKHGGKISSNDKNPRERKWTKNKDYPTWRYGNSKRVLPLFQNECRLRFLHIY